MDDVSQAIGRLEGLLETVQKDVTDIKKDVKNLNQFKWKVYGGVLALSVLLSGLIKIAEALKHT